MEVSFTLARPEPRQEAIAPVPIPRWHPVQRSLTIEVRGISRFLQARQHVLIIDGHLERRLTDPCFRRGGKYRVGAQMFDRLGEYVSRAVALRLLAKRTAHPEVQDQLLELAVAFERLANYAEKRQHAALPMPSD